MYSEGVDRLTVYGSSNIESKLCKNLKATNFYTVKFCQGGVSLLEYPCLDKDSAIIQVLDLIDNRFSILDFQGVGQFCKIALINTDYLIFVERVD